MTRQTISAAIEHEERTPDDAPVCDSLCQTYQGAEWRCTRAPHAHLTDGTAEIHVAGAVDGKGGQADIVAVWED